LTANSARRPDLRVVTTDPEAKPARRGRPIAKLPDAEAAFRSRVKPRKFILPETLLATGKIESCGIKDQGHRNVWGSYSYRADSPASGSFRNYADGLGWEEFHADDARPLTADELERREAARLADARKRLQEAKQRRREAIARALEAPE
jgi:hypothetical protein